MARCPINTEGVRCEFVNEVTDFVIQAGKWCVGISHAHVHCMRVHYTPVCVCVCLCVVPEVEIRIDSWSCGSLDQSVNDLYICIARFISSKHKYCD